MAFVVCAPCHDCKYTDCVVVCPCECFYQDEMQLYIDPQECIDCEACVPECPVEAIFHDSNVPTQWTHFVQLNAERVGILKTQNAKITERQDPREGPGCRRR
jgi:ferredoxin